MKQVNFFKKKIYLQIKSKESSPKIVKKFLTNEEVKILLNIEKNSKNERYNSNSNKHIKNNKTINLSFYKKYLTHHDIKDFNSLTPELAYEWKVGEALIWDRSQLHCFDNFQNTNALTKTAIAVFTNYEQ